MNTKTKPNPLNVRKEKETAEDTTTVEPIGTIELNKGEAFNKSFYYPANDTARLILNLVNGNKQGNLKRTTFDKTMVESCKALGYKVLVVPTIREIEEL